MKAATSGRGIVEWDAVISIHAAREGGDFARKVYDYRMRFQSTPPVKAATLLCRGCHDRQSISIHAAREGGDKPGTECAVYSTDISIHAAREGGDVNGHNSQKNPFISIHAAREGGDVHTGSTRHCHNHFNPRRP